MTEYGCSYKDCRVPPERHGACAAAPVSRCWGPVQHQHAPRRSRGGKECPVMLCAGHHGSVDNGHKYEGRRLRDQVLDYGDGDRRYAIYDRDTGERLVSIPLEGRTT